MPIKRHVVSFCLTLACLLAQPQVWAGSGSTSGLLWAPATLVFDASYRSMPVAVAGGVKTVAAGNDHTLILKTDGTLWATGGNVAGQLGIETGDHLATPVQIATNVASIHAFQVQTFFIKTDGTLWAAGSNSSGSLGISNAAITSQRTPIQIATNVKAVEASGQHTLFLKTDGTLWGMGNNAYGQLGLDPTALPSLAVPVQLATNVASIAVQAQASFFVKTDATLWGMGRNQSGELGTGNTAAISTPTLIATAVASVAASDDHTLFIKTNGTLWGMGANSSGQLGDADTSNHLPVSIAGGVSAVRAESAFTLFLKTDHTLWGMGSNQFGELGDGTTIERSLPVAIATGVAELQTTWRNSYFRKLDGSFWGMGDNIAGQLGDGTIITRNSPVQIAASIRSFAVGSLRAFYLTTKDELFGFGWAAEGQLGDGTVVPERLLLAPDAISAEIGSLRIWYAREDGSLWVNRDGQVPGVSDVQAVSVDDRDGLPMYLAEDGTARQLSADNTSTPLASGVTQVFSGYNYRLFLKADGTLWGLNLTPHQDLTPVFGDGTNAALVASDVTSVSATANHFLFVKNDHSLWGQGFVFGGWPGGVQSSLSTPVPLETEVISASAATTANVYLKLDGHLWVRGNGWGAGTGPALEVSSDVASATVGYQTVFYTKSDGTLYYRSNVGGVLGAETTVAGHTNRVSTAAFEGYIFIQDTGGTLPSLTLQPQSTGLAYGAPLLLEVNASGEGPLDYQWYKDGARLLHDRSAHLSLPYATGDVAGNYIVKVTNRAGSVTSEIATVTVTQATATVTLGSLAAVFDGTPKAATATTSPAGKNVTFTYDNSSTPPTLPGSYAVVATVTDPNYAGSASGTLVITDHGPVVTSHTSPRSMLTPGDGVSLTVTAAATGSPTYQWYHDGRTIDGATNASFVLTSATYADRGAYWVTINNAAGTTRSAPFFVQVAPAVTQVVAWGTDFGGGLHELAAQEDVVAVDLTIKWLVLKRDGTVARVGDDVYPVPPALSSGGVVAIAGGTNHLLALKADGTVVAWGQNTWGQTNVPAGLANVVAIAAGDIHSLALKNDGTVVAWGDSTAGQTAVPAGLTNVVAIAADNVASLALKSDGTVVGWGNNGNGIAKIPAGLSDVVAIDAGASFALALKSTGEIVSWGGGTDTAVPGGSIAGITEFSAGTTALVRQNNTLISWGTPDFAQTNVPSSLSGVFALSTGMFNSVALRDATANTAPVIVMAPANSTQVVNGNATFTIAASGSPTLTYRWQCWPAAGINEWADLSDGSNYSGTGTTTLSVQGLPLYMSGSRFRCLVTNTAGAIPSPAATLTINRIPVSFALSASTFTYNAAAQGPTVVATPAGATFQVVGPLSATGVADYSVTVIATGDYDGTATLPWSITKATQPPPVITSASSFTYANVYGVHITPGLGFGFSEFALGTGSTAANAAIDANANATATGLGTIVVKARYLGDINHLPSAYCEDFTITVLPAPTTFSLVPSTLTYTGSLQGPMVISLPHEATFTAGGTPSAVNAGTYTAIATATGNYSGTNNSLTWTINKAGQSVPVISSPALTFLGIPYTAVADAGSGPVEWTLGTGSTATGAGINASTGVLRASSLGTVVIKARFSGDENHVASAYCADFAVTVAPAPGVVAMSAGARHTVFIRSDGSLWGMGDNGNGQLGDGSTMERRHPVLIATGVAAASAGGSHTLFIKADGSLWGVGNNNQGNLGDGTHLERHLPIKIANDVAAVSAGNAHSLFLKQDGTLWGMGQNLGGLLGQGLATANQETPVQIATGVLAVSAGDMFSAFLKNDHSLWMMGGNQSGQLGDGTLENKLVPTLIATNVVSVSAGSNHTAFIKTDHSLWSMGTFYAIQTGVNANVVTPVQIDTNVSFASADNVISLYLKPDQTLWATGTNLYGAFGDGSFPINAGAQLPHPVGSGLVDVSVGGNYFSLFLKSDGSLLGAGLSVHGELGTEVNTNYNSAIMITGGPLTTPVAPSTVTVTEESPIQMARLTWNHVIGARRYEVWRSATSSSATAVRLAADLTANFFEDSTVENGVYYYWIKSIGPGGDSEFGAPATVILKNGPEITSQPSDVSAPAGQIAVFAVTTAGVSPFSYQWQILQSGGSTWNNLAEGDKYNGVSTDTLKIANVLITADSDDQFRCIASNGTGFATSNRATLIVYPVLGADFNGDGKPDLVLQNLTTGARRLRLMSGSTLIAEIALGELAKEWSIAATADFNNDGQPDLLLQNSNTGERMIRLMNGSTVSADVSLGSVPVEWSLAAAADFNGDGKADLLWQNTSTGERYLWFMNGTAHVSDVSLGIVPPEWSIAAAADFNGDGNPDLLWQNTTTGERYLWFMNGSTHVSDVSLGIVPPEWSIAAAADFNGDGKADLLWQNTTTGQCYLWFMNGSTHDSDADLGLLPAGWSLAGVPVQRSLTSTHDFNGDGNPDLLWQNTSTGERYLWFMNGSTHVSDVSLGIVPVEWSLVTAADFNGDGNPDLLWQNTSTGERYLWFMNGSTHVSDISLGIVPPEWALVTAADFNGDGNPDLLWQNTSTGERYLWFMNGSTHVSDISLGIVPPEWALVTAADFNGDGNPDLLWQNTSTGERYLWFMNGSTHVSDISLGIVPVEWSLVTAADFNGDGSPDLLWQNTSTGERYLWFMNGSTHVSDISLGIVPPEWSLVN